MTDPVWLEQADEHVMTLCRAVIPNLVEPYPEVRERTRHALATLLAETFAAGEARGRAEEREAIAPLMCGFCHQDAGRFWYPAIRDSAGCWNHLARGEPINGAWKPCEASDLRNRARATTREGE